ncbi:MAG: T9SS type A sorting domain-containing protein [Bacteroidetes bacterium]|nr:T9SS type A sorting domain-containing protein [Bacteroidota bacterium]
MKTMILKILPLFMMVIWAGIVRSQIGTTAGTLTSCPGDTAVPITVTNCNGVGAISLVLNFDNTKLTYLGYKNLHPSLTTGFLIINSTGNKVVISWANTSAANFGNTTLVELRFHTETSTTSLTWDTQTSGNCEYSDVSGNTLAATYTNGILTINQPPVINTQPVDRTALVGQNTSFSVSAAGTGISYLWQVSTNGGGTWTNLTNVAPYSGVTTPTLSLTNAQLTYNGYKYHCRLTGTCTPVVFTNDVTLTVINPITTTLPTPVNGSCPGSLLVPVTVTNFTDVAAFSLTFSYNASCLTYTGYQNLNGALTAVGSIFVVNATGGKVYMTWSNAAAATIGSGTLVELQFTSATGTSPLTWDVATEGNCEYTVLSGSRITSVFVDGNETIFALPTVTGHPSNRIIAKGQNTTFGATATGSGLSYLWQISTNGGSSFTDMTNTGYYSGVTTPTMSVTGAQLELSGYQFRCKISGSCLPVVFSNPAILTVLPNVLTTSGSATACPGQIVIPVNVTDFIGVASFSLALSYNSSVLTYAGYGNLNPAVSGGIFSASASGGKVLLSWSNITSATIAGGSVLVELKFDGVSGTSSLNWDTQTAGNCEFSDLSGQVIFSTWTNGSATINTAPLITVQPVNKTIYAAGSTSFSVSATGTGVGYLWQVSTNGGTTWTNLTNVSPYTGVTTPTLTINPASAGMNGYLYRCVVSGSCTQSLSNALTLQYNTVGSGQTTCYNATQTITVAGGGTTFIIQTGGNASMIAGQKISYLAGTKVSQGGYLHGSITTSGGYCPMQPPQSDPAQLTVTQAAITTTPGAVSGSCTGNLSIPVNVTNCTNVGSISLTMIYDTTKMTYEGYHSVNASLTGGLLVVNHTGNKVIFSWASATSASIGTGTLVQYRFKANAGISTTLTWDTPTSGACEYSDPAGAIITSFYANANISVAANALIVNAGPDINMQTSSVQLNGSATGGTAPYTWLWSPAGSLSNPTLSNPLASPASTTSYTLTATDKNGCAGSDVMDVVVGVITSDLTLQGITISNSGNCSNALQTITVAGGGTTYIVQATGSVTMIAGQKISYLNGTKVYLGGNLHGYITTSGQYCNTLLAPMVASAVEEILPSSQDESFFKVYPNPTTGRFTLELSDENLSGQVYVALFGTCGEKILEDEMTGESKKEFSLSGKPTGFYFIRVVNGKNGLTKKILKQ